MWPLSYNFKSLKKIFHLISGNGPFSFKPTHEEILFLLCISIFFQIHNFFSFVCKHNFWKNKLTNKLMLELKMIWLNWCFWFFICVSTLKDDILLLSYYNKGMRQANYLAKLYFQTSSGSNQMVKVKAQVIGQVYILAGFWEKIHFLLLHLLIQCISTSATVTFTSSFSFTWW